MNNPFLTVGHSILNEYPTNYPDTLVSPMHYTSVIPNEMEVEKTSINVPTPEYKTTNSAGVDLINNIGSDIDLYPGRIKLIPTGIKIKLPKGTFGMITPRSGKSITGFSVNNSPGIIDSDYRNEIMIIAINNSNEIIHILKDERIAQLVVMPYIQAHIIAVEKLSADDFNNERGLGGLGSTGKL